MKKPGNRLFSYIFTATSARYFKWNKFSNSTLFKDFQLKSTWNNCLLFIKPHTLYTIYFVGYAKKTLIPYEPTYGENFKRGSVKSIDTAANKVTLETGEEITYDYLVLATGSGGVFPAKLDAEVTDSSKAIELYNATVEKVCRDGTSLIILVIWTYVSDYRGSAYDFELIGCRLWPNSCCYNAPTDIVHEQLCSEWPTFRYWWSVQIFCYRQINNLRQNLYREWIYWSWMRNEWTVNTDFLMTIFHYFDNEQFSRFTFVQRPARERHKIRIASRENVDNQTPRNTNFTH